MSAMFYENDPFNLILRFMDGELPEQEHSAFFAQLALNDSLQKEFTATLAMRERLRNDIAIPPANVEQLLMQTAFPQTVPLSPLKAGLISGIGSSLLMLLLLWLLWKAPAGASEQGFVVQNTSQVTGRTTANTGKQAFASYATESNEPQSTTITSPYAHRTEQGYSAKPLSTMAQKQRAVSAQQPEPVASMASSSESSPNVESLTSTAPLSNAEQDIARTELPVVVLSQTPVLPSHSETSLSSPALAISNPASSQSYANTVSPLLSDGGERSWKAEFRMFSMRSYPNPSLPGLISPPINNFGITVMKSISESQSIGVEVGQETLLQTYTMQLQGREVNVEQNYLAWWIGAAYQYTPSWSVLGIANPMVRVSAGATRIGPLGRMILGMQFNANDNISFIAGGETMGIISWQQGNSILSAKLGMTGGISVRF